MYVCVSESEYGRNQRMGCHFLSVHNSLKSGCTCVHVYLFISTCIVYCAIETSVKQTSVGARSAIGYVQKDSITSMCLFVILSATQKVLLLTDIQLSAVLMEISVMTDV